MIMASYSVGERGLPIIIHDLFQDLSLTLILLTAFIGRAYIILNNDSFWRQRTFLFEEIFSLTFIGYLKSRISFST